MGANGVEILQGRPRLILRFGHRGSLGADVSTAPKWPRKPAVRRRVLISAHSRYWHAIRIRVDPSEGETLPLLVLALTSVALIDVISIRPGRVSYGLS
jgi:hypothetical protein